jgi:transcriptional regulator of arginine metabolism
MRRREAIRELIAASPVRSQKELGRLLRARGLAAAQPTLSRDIRELGLVKGPAGYTSADAAAGAETAVAGTASLPHRRLQSVERLVFEFVLSAETAGTLVVLRTPPADAQPVALAIDGAAIDGIVGTLAGDDTIFLATRSAAAARSLADRFRQIIGARTGSGPARFSARRRPSGSARRRA